MTDAWLGIDWSGSKAARLPGIRVAEALPGDGPPTLLPGPREGGLWRRLDVLDLLLARRAAGQRVVAGFDFAFAYAHGDRGAYFPGFGMSPPDVRGLWALVDALAGDGRDLYGGAVYGPGSPVGHHYWTAGRRPAGFVERRRRTEIACGTAVTWPHPVFKCFSAANVGTGSLAGMRLLHRLGNGVAVWPFDGRGDFTVVEIFPRLYVRRTGTDPRRLFARPEAVAGVLEAYGCRPYGGPALDTEDKLDAVVSAAALRALSGESRLWDAPAGEPAAQWEGWIFGVESAKPGAP